jgi:hypothetical protein
MILPHETLVLGHLNQGHPRIWSTEPHREAAARQTQEDGECDRIVAWLDEIGLDMSDAVIPAFPFLGGAHDLNQTCL